MILVAIITSFSSCIAKYVVCNFLLSFSKSSQIQQDGLFGLEVQCSDLESSKMKKNLTLFFLGHLHILKLEFDLNGFVQAWPFIQKMSPSSGCADSLTLEVLKLEVGCVFRRADGEVIF